MTELGRTRDAALICPEPDPADLGTGWSDLDGLFRRYHGDLVRLAVVMVRDLPTAEDVVQDVFAHIQAHPGLRPKPGCELAYLRVCVLNGCRSLHRRRAVAQRLGLEGRTDPGAWSAGSRPGDANVAVGRCAEPTPHESAEAEAIRAEDGRRVLAALTALPSRRREVLVLRYYIGLSEAEIAATLGISAGGVKSAASRGLAALARRLGEES
jgi:RNA polymerase sigma factor (sigma-70 family)